VLKSELPGAVDQVASWPRAGIAASKATAAVVANKCARIWPPPSGDVSTQIGFALVRLSNHRFCPQAAGSL
jgi:hypothetical protein